MSRRVLPTLGRYGVDPGDCGGQGWRTAASFSLSCRSILAAEYRQPSLRYRPLAAGWGRLASLTRFAKT